MTRVRLGIRLKLTLVFVLFAAVLLVGVSILSFENARSALQAATVSELLSTAIEKEAALNSWIADRAADILTITAYTHFQDKVAELIITSEPTARKVAHGHILEDLHNWVGAPHGIQTLLIIEPETGQVIAATETSEEGKFKESHPYFINGKDGIYVQNPYYDLALEGTIMTISAPIMSRDGQVLAVVAGHLSMAGLNDIVNRRTGLHRTDDAFLVNTSNLFITQPRLATDLSVLRRGIHSEEIDRCLAHNSGTAAAADYRGVPALIVYRWLPERQLCLEVKIDQAEAFAAEHSLSNTLLITGVAILLLASALAFMLARTITEPVRLLVKGTEAIGAGDLDHRIDVKSKDELGQLALAFNQMAANLGRSRGELVAAIEELEAFSYTVAHDLRSPLRAIDGFSRVLLEDCEGILPAEAARYLGLVRSNTQQMGQLVDDLLHFAHLGRQPLKKQLVDPTDLVQQALADLHTEQEGRQIKITIGDMPACEGDPILLKQVFVNLLDNALKFTRHRELAEIEVGYDSAYFVRDNGIGFDMQYVDKLFHIFQRLQRAEDYDGTGVGLASVQRIISHHGGHIWAEAELNQGATFYFTL